MRVGSTPEIEVELGPDKFTPRLSELAEDERTQRFEEQASLTPQFGEYAISAAPRVIPVFGSESV